MKTEESKDISKSSKSKVDKKSRAKDEKDYGSMLIDMIMEDLK